MGIRRSIVVVVPVVSFKVRAANGNTQLKVYTVEVLHVSKAARIFINISSDAHELGKIMYYSIVNDRLFYEKKMC